MGVLTFTAIGIASNSKHLLMTVHLLRIRSKCCGLPPLRAHRRGKFDGGSVDAGAQPRRLGLGHATRFEFEAVDFGHA
ncbi:hypothetical protein OIE50_01045 [Streptomyces canus]|uniref:hypothetical protein n=1 Tax=Streptomyces canus TaxID=58343 RepID=UPI0032568528